jgi:hypothetical protein
MSNGTISARGQYDALGNLGINATGAPVTVPGLNYAATDMGGPLNDALKMYRAAIVNASSQPTAARQRVALDQNAPSPHWRAPQQQTPYERQMEQYALQKARLAAQPSQNYATVREGPWGIPRQARTLSGVENLGPMDSGLSLTGQQSEAETRKQRTLNPLQEEQLRQESEARQKSSAWGRG